jgi:hypothetical protein
MATREEKEKLVEALKFIPGTYTIQCWGYGGEIVLGRVEKESYDYFVEHEVDLDEFATDWNGESTAVPEEVHPFPPGEWHSCDDICHENGVEMSDLCLISVSDSTNTEIWNHRLEPFMLEESGVGVECVEEYYASYQGEGSIVFLGQSIEKGTFFKGTIELTSPFDPTKLKLFYNDIEGWPLLYSISYNEEDVYNDDYDTRGKSMEFKFLNTE